jgi:ribonuclease-3
VSSGTNPSSLEAPIALQETLGVWFKDPSLLLRSLAHRSWCAENGEAESNERLEFLGDSVLGLVVTHYVFEPFPHLPEGQLSEVRAGVVNARVLAERPTSSTSAPYVLLGKAKTPPAAFGQEPPLADAFRRGRGCVLDAAGDRVIWSRCFQDRIAGKAAAAAHI